jgi:hypothetical protein
LGGAHPLGEFALTQAGLGTQVIDQLPERKVLLDGATGLGARGGALALMSVQREWLAIVSRPVRSSGGCGRSRLLLLVRG